MLSTSRTICFLHAHISRFIQVGSSCYQSRPSLALTISNTPLYKLTNLTTTSPLPNTNQIRHEDSVGLLRPPGHPRPCRQFCGFKNRPGAHEWTGPGPVQPQRAPVHGPEQTPCGRPQFSGACEQPIVDGRRGGLGLGLQERQGRPWGRQLHQCRDVQEDEDAVFQEVRWQGRGQRRRGACPRG